MNSIKQIENAVNNIAWHLEREKGVTKRFNLLEAIKFLDRAIILINKSKKEED